MRDEQGTSGDKGLLCGVRMDIPDVENGEK